MRMSEAALLSVLAAAVITDVKTGKIKNSLTLPAIACGPLLSLIDGGRSEAALSLAGMGVMILVAAVLILPGMMGGGDAKLLIAVGSLGGLSVVKATLLYTALAGGAFALFTLVRLFGVKALARQAAQATWLRLGLGVGSCGTPSGKTRLPYSIPITIGAAAAMFWRL